MKILITGANGFIGRRITQRLLKNGHEIVGSGRGQPNVQHERYRYVQGNLVNVADCMRMVEGAEYVIHCAGKAGVWEKESLILRQMLLEPRI